jgi:hypothetical protein
MPKERSEVLRHIKPPRNSQPVNLTIQITSAIIISFQPKNQWYLDHETKAYSKAKNKAQLASEQPSRRGKKEKRTASSPLLLSRNTTIPVLITQKTRSTATIPKEKTSSTSPRTSEQLRRFLAWHFPCYAPPLKQSLSPPVTPPPPLDPIKRSRPRARGGGPAVPPGTRSPRGRGRGE